MAAELIEHPKEVAEHVMLVDLARNDVGRVVEFGSLQIDEMMTLEKYSHVMHLTSQVSGELRSGKTAIASPIECLMSCSWSAGARFPGDWSVTELVFLSSTSARPRIYLSGKPG